ncbi:hypothetical protein [Streptococcus thoraltensis]|uniref:hypothetical protein n=1 Tax=Streptococcus thoraltensis TaxID=55085 RepID=UPI001F594B79|nr:hypothetical protein [Streptococcus thoraltensis]
MVKISPKEFALAVVTSSSPNLSIEDKIKLFEDAYEAVEIHNKPIVEDEKEEAAKRHKAITEAYTRGDSMF